MQTKTCLFFLACFFLPLCLIVGLPAAHSSTTLLPRANTQLPAQPILLARKCRRRTATADSRNPLDPFIPYIISPRRALVLHNTPKLRWNAVPGVITYHVSLLEGEETIWQTTLNNNEIIYPGEPALEPGKQYSLVVKTDRGRSSQEELKAKEFSLLSTAKAQTITAAIEQLQNQSSTDKNQALLSAYLYIGAELKYEAITSLETLLKEGFDDANIYRRLGDLYWQTDVILLAESNYLEAEKRAVASNNFIEQAQVQEALAEIYLYLGDESEALHRFIQAKENYQRLGYIQKVKELEIEIKAFSES